MMIPQFGTRIAGQEYVCRPSAYVIIRDPEARLAVVSAPSGLFLPGGGQRPGESPENAALRELAEECGLDAEIVDKLGVADEFLYSEAESTYFRKRSTFFRARPNGKRAGSVAEPDHQLVWLAGEDAPARLSHASHRWAVAIRSPGGGV